MKEKITYQDALLLLDKWDDENPDNLEWYMTSYGESLIKWLYEKGYISSWGG